MAQRTNTRLRDLAWINAGFHLVGVAFLALGMRAGSPLVALEERAAWLAGFPTPWMLGWGCWMLCALMLLGFFLFLRWDLGPPAVGLWPVVLVGIGAAVDLGCDVGHIGMSPLLAREEPLDGFRAFERTLYFLGLVVANGAYSVAVLGVSRTMRRAGRVCASTHAFGIAAFAGGAVMALGGAIDVPLVYAAATGPTMIAFCFWSVLVARDARASAAG